MDKFRLTEDFIDKYKDRKPPFGFGGLGELVYMRTYSRIKENESNERWHETIRRVVEGTYNMQKRWVELNGLGWNPQKAQRSAQEMYERMWSMKFLPPGRGLWAMGSPITEERECFAALNNCGFVSTREIATDFTKPFCFLMDASMLGVGVGFDTLGARLVTLRQPKTSTEEFIIPDSREGWVESVQRLLNSYAKGGHTQIFDYSLIRPAGAPIKGFGGVASGPEPLEKLHERIREILDTYVSRQVTKRCITDIMNMIGCCVVAGNVRRTAELALNFGLDLEFLQLKDYQVNPERAAFGWASNNSIDPGLGADYTLPAELTRVNGEPGYVWMDNVRAYSRMNNGPDHKDHKADGVNPCQPAWAPLLTLKGLTTMGKVKAGDYIWTKDGWSLIVAKKSSGVQTVKRYATRAGSFVGTGYHRIVCNGVKIEADQAKAIDTLQGPSGIFAQHPDLTTQAIMDGLVIGDGCLNSSTRGRKILLHIGKNDHSYFKNAVNGLIGSKYSDDPEETAYEVTATITPEELPAIPERKVPERFKTIELMASFLRGLYSANGSVVRSRITLKTVSPTLRDDVQLMLSALGIRSYYTVNKAKTVKFANGAYACKESYDVNISTDRYLFAQFIGFIQPYKTAKLEALIDALPSKYAHAHPKKTYDIVEVETLGDEEVFNITVNNTEHTYWTGGLNVANCGEQSLESMELCCLVESFPHRHENLADYKRTLKFAYLYAKTVTLGKTHWAETNRILLRNRRIGCSMSGIAQFIATRGLHALKQWATEGYDTIQSYDEVYSDWLCIPRSIKTTSVKPSGTVSLLAGATPGIHYPESRFYIRRMRLDSKSDLIQPLNKAGYKVEPCVGQEDSTVVVEIPVKIGESIRTQKEVTMWEQLSLAAFMQKYWADNQVSATITFDPETEGREIANALNFFQYQMKGISLLPRLPAGAYAQMPYEAIDEDCYNKMAAGITLIDFSEVNQEKALVERFCDGDHCTL